jgi:type IV fimbrial biogenesis protein FimT
MRKCLLNSSRGVSLIELMIALTILGVLVGLAVPSFQSFIISNRLTSQTNELLGGYQVARAEAIRLNRPIHFCRAANAAALVCAGGAQATWQFWIVVRPDLPNANPDRVIQRGAIRPDMITRASAAMLNDTVVLRSDSLAANINNAALTATLQVCAATANPQENSRRVRIALSRAVIERAQLGANGCNAAPGNA